MSLRSILASEGLIKKAGGPPAEAERSIASALRHLGGSLKGWSEEAPGKWVGRVSGAVDGKGLGKALTKSGWKGERPTIKGSPPSRFSRKGFELELNFSVSSPWVENPIGGYPVVRVYLRQSAPFASRKDAKKALRREFGLKKKPAGLVLEAYLGDPSDLRDFREELELELDFENLTLRDVPDPEKLLTFLRKNFPDPEKIL